jgi:uncharacterized delta-60 repeat protein/uncharacterized repeat protein (TIGR01451 family)
MNQSLLFLRESILFILLIANSLIPKQAVAQNPALPNIAFDPGTFNSRILTFKIQSDNKIIAVGDFTYFKTYSYNRVIRLNPDGTLDNSFNPGTGADNSINCIAIQSNGKILLGGIFQTFNDTPAKGLVRLNSDGTVDNSFDIGSGITGAVESMLIQADGKIIVGGNFSNVNGTSKNNIVRLNTDGSIDNTFLATGSISPQVTIIKSIIQQSDLKIIIGGNFSNFNGISKNNLVRLNTDGTIDNSFTTGTGPNNTVYDLALQSNGMLLIGGEFTSYNGTNKNSVIRVNTNGTLDNTFLSNTNSGGYITSILIHSSGKLVIGGDITAYNGIGTKYYTVLNSDGSLDNAFNNSLGADDLISKIVEDNNGKILLSGNFTSINNKSYNSLSRIDITGTIDTSFNPSYGASWSVNKVKFLSDGKLILAGRFFSYNQTLIRGFIKINSDGSIDNSFNQGTGFNGPINSFEVQKDGKIIVVGSFSSYNGTIANNIIRLNLDGSVDGTFNCGTGSNSSISCVTLQSDGKIYIGGQFTSYNGTSINRIARLNQDGTLDTSFNVGTGADQEVAVITIQKDGKILLGGSFTNYRSTLRNKIIRVNSDGTVDNTFSIGTGANGAIVALTIQEDGNILMAGYFTSYNGISKNYITRLLSNGSIDPSFNSGLGFDLSALSLYVMPDTRILIGGSFNSYQNTFNSKMLIRLNSDGSIDHTFHMTSSPSGSVYSIDLDNNGKIAIAGDFDRVQDYSFNNIAMLKGEPTYFYKNKIGGTIYIDGNNDCTLQNTETTLPSMIVKANSNYGGTDGTGKYKIIVDTGNVAYNLTQEFNEITSLIFTPQCSTSYNINLKGSLIDTAGFNFANNYNSCHLLNINIQNNRMRRCFSGNTYVNYINYGNQTASNAQIKIIYPKYVIPISSVPMWSSKQDSLLIYDLGDLLPGTDGSIILVDSVACGMEEIRGLTQCIKAYITPTSDCTKPNSNWDKSSMEIEGNCYGGEVNFLIVNDGTGDMADSLDYRIFANDTLIFIGKYKLKSKDSLSVTYPGNGEAIRLEADQHPLHPGNSRPRATIESCGEWNIKYQGLALNSPQDDMAPEDAITCNTIVDSYDPNEKVALPKGIGVQHKLIPGEEIEYTIHFQNTGSDTAYTVKIIDTLDLSVEPTSFIPGVSSHPYQLSITGKDNAVLSFSFNNIKLPDSNHNVLKSNGLVSFRIKTNPNEATGTMVKNKAYIYFDYNNAIITNETFHTLDTEVEQDLSKGKLVQVGKTTLGVLSNKTKGLIKLYPNPNEGSFMVELPENSLNGELRISSLLGRTEVIKDLNSDLTQVVNIKELKAGTYIYEIDINGVPNSNGLLIIK